MEPIDIVIPWVDDTDPNWIESRQKFLPEFKESKKNLSHYFRDWDTLRYVFRGIECNMPWIRYVHFLTCGHLPKWLNIRNPKLKIHKHSDFFSEKSSLPVFSSHPIEMNIRNIPGLAEKFIYFNDDTLVTKPVEPTRFFCGNKPYDYLVLDIPRGGWLYDRIRIKDSYASICKNSIRLLNTIFPLRSLLRKKPNLFFNESYTPLDKLRNLVLGYLGVHSWIKVNHHPQGLLLSNLHKCYELFHEEIDNTSQHRFRAYEDVNQYLFREYALMSGNFIPKYFNDSFCIVLASLKRYDKERNTLSEKSFVCLNDSSFLEESEYPELKKRVQADLNRVFPNPSTYEIN